MRASNGKPSQAKHLVREIMSKKRVAIASSFLAFLCLLALGGLRLAKSSNTYSPLHEIRLTDVFRKKMDSQGTVASASSGDSSRRLGHELPLRGWLSADGVRVVLGGDGSLLGKMTSNNGIIRIKGMREPNPEETLFAIEVSGSFNSSGELAIAFVSPDGLGRVPQMEDALSWDLNTALVPDGKLRTYLIQPKRPLIIPSNFDLLLRPINVSGASFDLKGLRIISRNNYSQSLPAGVGWHGMNEVYKDTLVVKQPVASIVRTRIPENSVLDVALGTIASEPITFQVRVQSTRASCREKIFTRSLGLPHRWAQWSIDLEQCSESEASFSFSVLSRSGQAHGFWGNPVIRNASRKITPASPRSRVPHGVIVIWIDSLRKDHLKAYGYKRETAPTISGVAKQGTLISDCISQASWTKVSTPSFLASLYPLSHGVLDFSDRLASSVITLPEVFQEAGYSTVSFSSILLTGKFSNLHQGFDQVVESLAFPDRDSSKTSHAYVPMAIEWIEENGQRPFFMFLHLYDPHDPYRPKSPLDRTWTNEAAVESFNQETRTIEDSIADPLLRRFKKPTLDELKAVNVDAHQYAEVPSSWYDASILAMDFELRKLFASLTKMRLDKDTLVVIASDHGEEFFEHGRMFHGQSVYRELIEVPLIFWWPGVVSDDARVDATVEMVDVMPTVLELSGLSVPIQAQGASFANQIRVGNDQNPRTRVPMKPAFAMKAKVSELLSPPPRETESYTVIDGEWKLIHNLVPGKGQPEFELYNRLNDHKEQVNLAPNMPHLVSRLARLLDSWRRFTSRQQIKEDIPNPAPLDGEVLRRLISLGYLQGKAAKM